MTLEQAIMAILADFNTGDYFDSHTVIDALMQNKDYHLAYLQGYSNTLDVKQYHGNIAKMIRDSGIVNRIGIAKTHTIYGNLSDNALWQKNE
jgi:hypothetical protein